MNKRCVHMAAASVVACLSCAAALLAEQPSGKFYTPTESPTSPSGSRSRNEVRDARMSAASGPSVLSVQEAGKREPGKTSFRPAKPTQPRKEASYWLSADEVKDVGIKAFVASNLFPNFEPTGAPPAVDGPVFVPKESFGPTMSRDGGFWLEDKLPGVTIRLARTRYTSASASCYSRYNVWWSDPGGKNYAAYERWEQRCKEALPPLSPVQSSGQRWSAEPLQAAIGDSANENMEGLPLTSAVVMATFAVQHDQVGGVLWLHTKRVQERRPGDRTPGFECRLVEMKGKLVNNAIDFEAERLRGHMDYVGKGYALRGKIRDKEFFLLNKSLMKATYEAQRAIGPEPTPEPTWTESGTSRYARFD